jgi:stage IV sporulation protein B
MKGDGLRVKTAKISAIFAAVLALTLALGPAALAAELLPGGMTVGLSLKTKGVLVSRLCEVETASGPVSPARDAGLRPGDCILRVEGEDVTDGADLVRRLSELDGGAVALTISRGGEETVVSVTPACGTDGAWQLGLLLRDGAAGIGTVTYVDPASGQYGALGHGVNDVDSGALLPGGDGTVSPSVIVDVVPGAPGAPGELCGVFDPAEAVGDIDRNTPFGIFGDLERYDAAAGTVETAGAQEVHTGKATILSNISGDKVEEYAVELTRVNCGARDGRCFVIKVTDPRLLEVTGGILCGMSGSPILQDGKLVGAVTHV